MEVATFDRLLAPEGDAALAAATELAPTEARYPACADRLGKRFPPDLARAALDTVMLRIRAQVKFSRADRMFFTREALEQATSEPVATYRAERLAGFGTVADLCCGIGGDAVAFAGAGCGVVAVDRDPLRLRMAEANLAAYGRTGRFVRSDVIADALPVTDAVFADPGRRPGDRRVLSVRDYEPSVDALLARLPAGTPFGVKVAPGVPRDDIRRFDAEAEFVSLGGELKECVFWFGPLKRAAVRAVVLPGRHTLTSDGPPPPVAEVRSPGRFLLDPDPAVTRSNLVGVLAAEIGAWGIDHDIAMLTSDTHTPTPFAVAYRVEEVLPFHAKRVGEWLRARGVGRVTMVKRGSQVDADELRSRWKLKGSDHRAVILTRAEGEAVAVVAERIDS